MIKIENIDVYGWVAAIRGARNPMNSWDKMDSGYELIKNNNIFKIGKNDYELLKKLCIAGKDHRKWMRMIDATMDITAPLYLWKEIDTYKVGTVANSCSTMHKIHAKEFELNDFSYEHLNGLDCIDIKGEFELDDKQVFPFSWLNLTIQLLNRYREKYLETKDKKWWWAMIQTLPSSYNQKRTLHLNYETLNAMYHARKNHKLDEWRKFCKHMEDLPYSEFITMNFK